MSQQDQIKGRATMKNRQSMRAAPQNDGDLEFISNYTPLAEPTEMVAKDGKLYLTLGKAGLEIVDVSNPLAPADIGTCEAAGRARGVTVDSGFIYVTGYDHGITILEISNPADPTVVGYYDTPGLATGLAVSGGHIYVADSSSFGIYDYVAASGIYSRSEFMPQVFSLHPAFPNPFNATTTLQMDLPRAVKGRLVAYDLLGRETATLMEGNMEAGSHAVRFDAGALPSGTYFVRLESADLQAAQKVVLVK
jgi:hypothetical protein